MNATNETQAEGLTIHKDTTRRGTPEAPIFFVLLNYGSRPAQECWLEAATMEEARAEVSRRFPR